MYSKPFSRKASSDVSSKAERFENGLFKYLALSGENIILCLADF
jgi:hypothetical protein